MKFAFQIIETPQNIFKNLHFEVLKFLLHNILLISMHEQRCSAKKCKKMNSAKKKHVFSNKKNVFFYSLAFCYTRMFNRYVLIKCYVILLRIAIANIWG